MKGKTNKQRREEFRDYRWQRYQEAETIKDIQKSFDLIDSPPEELDIAIESDRGQKNIVDGDPETFFVN